MPPTQGLVAGLLGSTKWQTDAIESFLQAVLTTECIPKSTLIILQGECASINGTRFHCIGTPFATTCHIAFFMNKSRSIVVCCHLDEGVNTTQIKRILSLFTSDILKKQGIELYLIGGYLDEKGTSIKVTEQLLSLISSKKCNVNLCLLFTGSLNTEYKTVSIDKSKSTKVAIPKYQSIGYNLKENVFVSLKSISGSNIPHYTLRSAVIFDVLRNPKLRVIYDCCNQRYVENGLTIEAFKWRCPNWIVNVLRNDIGDERLLQIFSTSPYAEHGEFAQDSRNLFRFVHQNEPKNVFKKGKAIYFRNGIELNDLNQSPENDGGNQLDDAKENELDQEVEQQSANPVNDPNSNSKSNCSAL